MAVLVVPFGLSLDWVDWSPLLLHLRGLHSLSHFASRFSPAVTLHIFSLGCTQDAFSICSFLVFLPLPTSLKEGCPSPIATAFLIASHFTFPFKRFSCSDYLHSQMVTIRPVWKPHTKPFLPSHAILTSANLLFISFPWCLLLSRFSFKDYEALCHLILPIFSQSRSWLKIPLL